MRLPASICKMAFYKMAFCKMAPSAKPGLGRLALAAIGLLSASLLALPQAAFAQHAVGSLKVDPDTSTGAIIMSWGGPVGAPMAQQISSAFQENRHKAQRVVFKIASGGGSVAEGERVIKVLRDIRLTHMLETVVEQGRSCGSMCVFIYLQGERRTAALSSLWLFHEVSHSDPRTGEITRLDRPGWERLVSLYYGPAGVSAEWTARMKPYTINSDYWQTGADLISARSGIFHFALGNQKERQIAGRPTPPPARVAEVPRPEAPRAVPPPKPEAPRIDPPAAPSAPPPTAEKPAPTKPAPRILVQYETKECRRLDPERSVYVNVPCEQASLRE